MVVGYSLPRTSRFSGHLSLIARDKLGFFERCERDFPIAKLRVYHVPVYVVSDPELVGQVLVTRGADFIKTLGLRTAGAPLFGDGILTAEGDIWKLRAARLRPHFQPRRVRSYLPAIRGCTEALLSDFRLGQERDVHRDMAHLTLEIACQTLFGVDAQELRDGLLGACDAAQAFFQAWERTYTPAPHLMPNRENLDYRRAVRRLDRIIYRLIARRRRERRDCEDILSLLLRHRDDNGQAMPDKLIRDELVTLFLASYETTAAVLAWTLYLISSHAEVEARVKQELERELGAAPAGPDALRRLSYLHNVVREALRLYPSVPVIGRQTVRPTMIGRQPIEKGAQLLISPWAINRSARHYDDPASFRPERWTDEFSAQLPRYAYIPFSSGPRVCLGQYLAVQETMQIVSTILQSATLRPAHAAWPAFDAQITNVPRSGSMQLRVEMLYGQRHDSGVVPGQPPHAGGRLSA